MVNSNSNNAQGGSTAGSGSGGNPGAGSNPGSGTAGSGSASGTVVSGSIPATIMPHNGFRDEVATLVGAVGTQLLDDVDYVVAGQSMTKASILAVFQTVLALYSAVDAGVQTLKSKRLALRATLPGVHQFTGNFKAMLIGLFGKGNPVLESFGIGAKRHKLTSEQQTARVLRALQTRAQRGTSGKRQKAANKFTGKIEVQTSVSGAEIKGGNPSPTPSAK